MDGQEIATLTHPVCLPGDQHCVPHVVVEPGSGPGRPEHGDQSEASIKWCVLIIEVLQNFAKVVTILGESAYNYSKKSKCLPALFITDGLFG